MTATINSDATAMATMNSTMPTPEREWEVGRLVDVALNSIAGDERAEVAFSHHPVGKPLYLERDLEEVAGVVDRAVQGRIGDTDRASVENSVVGLADGEKQRLEGTRHEVSAARDVGDLLHR